MVRNPKFKNEVLAVYDCWIAGGHTPYEYLFVLPNGHLEVDHAVLRVGVTRDNEELEKIRNESK